MDYFTADVDRSKCLHATSSKTLFSTHCVGNVIYHKFSHGYVFCRFNRKNVNAMLESMIHVKPHFSNVTIITAIFVCIQMFGIFMVQLRKATPTCRLPGVFLPADCQVFFYLQIARCFSTADCQVFFYLQIARCFSSCRLPGVFLPADCQVFFCLQIARCFFLKRSAFSPHA